MSVLDENNVRGFKIIDDRIWVGKVWEIIPKDHLRVLEEGLKTVCKAVPGRFQTMEQFTARRHVDAPLKGVLDGNLTMGGKGCLSDILANDGEL